MPISEGCEIAGMMETHAFAVLCPSKLPHGLDLKLSRSLRWRRVLVKMALLYLLPPTPPPAPQSCRVNDVNAKACWQNMKRSPPPPASNQRKGINQRGKYKNDVKNTIYNVRSIRRLLWEPGQAFTSLRYHKYAIRKMHYLSNTLSPFRFHSKTIQNTCCILIILRNHL